jgi:amino acid transporter
MSKPTAEFKKVFKIQEPTQVMPNMNYVESADHIFHQTKPSPDAIRRILPERKTVFRSRKLARPYWDDNTYETMQGVGWTFVVIGLFFFVCVLVFIGLNAGAGFTAISTFWGFVLLILFWLLGLLLTFIFGIIGAILFSMGIAAIGLLLVLISYIVLQRRHRFE